MNHGTGSAAETLDRIRQGGTNLVLTATQRLAETQRELTAGNFAAALVAAGSLVEKLGQLAHAEGTVGRLSEGRIVRAGEVTPGMHLVDVGEVVAVEWCENCHRPECDNRTIEVEGGSRATIDCDDEVVVLHGDDSAA